MTLAPGWYPSPSVPDRDQWWNGRAWTPMTQPSDPSFAAPIAVPPASALSSAGIGAATLPTAIIGVAVSTVSLTVNPFFIMSVIGVVLGAAVLFSARRIEHRAARMVLLVVSLAGIAAGFVGVVLEFQRLFG
ncbi:hypothetical protein BH10ACT7_BH10ACT7_09350 [soil metagenome]